MNDFPPLTVIEASAGTGKTFTLVTRLLKLIFCGGVAPERIVALTFSRAAAGEIFNKFIERLARAAESPAAAREESEKHVGMKLAPQDFAAMLRKVMPNLPEYHNAGWVGREVLEFDESVRRNLNPVD